MQNNISLQSEGDNYKIRNTELLLKLGKKNKQCKWNSLTDSGSAVECKQN